MTPTGALCIASISFHLARTEVRSSCKIPHANRFSSSRIMLIWIMAALLTVNLS
jgi:hypothetical protein